jgi:predicted TIM-barrel fold metal-dependent hydrolase
MDADGVSAEVLYPSLAMKLYSLEDPDLQRRCFRRYNEWLAGYCAVAPQRLVGIGLVPAWDMDVALAEVSWCVEHGMRGIQVWQIPPPTLSFTSSHYDALWGACADAGLPVSLHILTGFGYAKEVFELGPAMMALGTRAFSLAISRKLLAVQDSLMELVLSGVLDRHPRLRLVVVENEAAWLPFFIDQLDYYYHRFSAHGPIALARPPSESFAEQLCVTFFRDPNVRAVAERLGPANLMWSSDYPHGNSTWPRSRQVVADRLDGLPKAAVDDITWGNVSRLYGLDVGPGGLQMGGSAAVR